MQSGSNFLSVCIFPQVIENIPLASLPGLLKVGEIAMYTRNLRACCRKPYRNPDIEAAPPYARPALGDAQRWWYSRFFDG